MLPESREGENLTDLERRIARLAADFIQGGPKTLACDNSKKTLRDALGDVSDERVDMGGMSVENRGDFLRVTIFADALPSPLSLGLELDLAFDTDLDGQADRRLVYRSEEGGWTVTVPALDDPPSVALRRPLTVTTSHGSPGIVGLALDVPKAVLGDETGPLGLAVRLALPGTEARDVVPDAGFLDFDRTLPTFAILLDEQSRTLRADPGGSLRIRGNLRPSATFVGAVELSLLVPVKGDLVSVPLASLPAPLPATFDTTARLPHQLSRGTYGAFVVGECPICRASTSDSLSLVPAGRGFPLMKLWIAVLIVVALVLLFPVLRRARRG